VSAGRTKDLSLTRFRDLVFHFQHGVFEGS
jgi:hypothetical protein